MSKDSRPFIYGTNKRLDFSFVTSEPIKKKEEKKKEEPVEEKRELYSWQED